MLTIQSFLKKWKDNIGEGNDWLLKQHPVEVSKDFLASKLTNYAQELHDVYLYTCDHGLRYHTKISDECDGLILDEHLGIVSKPFNRIHNIDKRSAPDMNWDHNIVEHDFDGKVVVFFNHFGTWFMQTKRSIHAGDVLSVPSAGRTISYRTRIEEFIRDKHRVDDIQIFLSAADKHACFVCMYVNPEVHMCGPRGKEELILLGVTDKSYSRATGAREMFSGYVDDVADMLGFSRPACLMAGDREGALSYMSQLEPWHKGLIIQDDYHKRIRVVNPKYKLIKRLLNAGDDFTKRQLIAMFLTGAGKNVSVIEPKYNGPLKIFETMIDKRFNLTQGAWNKAKDAKSQKEFAWSVDHSLLNYILFHVRKHGPIDRTEFIQAIKPGLVEGFIKNIGELDAFERAIDKARSQREISA